MNLSTKLILRGPIKQPAAQQKLALSHFVPKYNPLSDQDFQKIHEFVTLAKSLFVLSGAGISTESGKYLTFQHKQLLITIYKILGIPDYRSEGVGLYAKSDRRPIQFKDFLDSPSKRKMYWARNYVSWPRFSSFEPNINHKILAKWERKGKIFHQVTQNVDSLLVKAGCLNLTELHGSSYSVRCVDCSFGMTRDSMQLLIKKYNPAWSATSTELAPDNDVVLSEKDVATFVLPNCPSCGNNRLKPEVGMLNQSLFKSCFFF